MRIYGHIGRQCVAEPERDEVSAGCLSPIKPMSRWKRLEELERNMASMSAEQLRIELVFWRQHAQLLSQPARKGAFKLVYKIEKLLTRKLNELSADEDQT